MHEHELKTWPEFFRPIIEDLKTFEVRRNDRPFEEQDTLFLREWCPEYYDYTGLSCKVLVTYILKDPKYVKKNTVIMGIKLLPETVVKTTT